jgi:hypothetical protein
MLNDSMYQAVRFLSQAGTCWTTATRTTSSGGSKRIAGSRKTLVVWYDWLRGVLTSRTCARAAPLARSRKVPHVRRLCSFWRRGKNGSAAALAAIPISTR